MNEVCRKTLMASVLAGYDMFTRIIIVIDGDWKLLGVLHSKPLQELHYEGSGTTTNLDNIKWIGII